MYLWLFRDWTTTKYSAMFGKAELWSAQKTVQIFCMIWCYDVGRIESRTDPALQTFSIGKFSFIAPFHSKFLKYNVNYYFLPRLVAEVDTGFAQVSFYHSSSGIEYRAKLQMRPTHEEQHATAKTPLRATFEDDLISEDEANNSDDDEDPTLLRHGEDIHGNELIPGHRRPTNVNSVLFPASDLPSAFQTTTPPSSLPTNNNNRQETTNHIPTVPLLYNRPSDTNRNNRTDQIKLIPPPPNVNSNRFPISGGNYSNGPSSESAAIIQFSPAAGGSVSLSKVTHLDDPMTNPKSELNRFQSRPINGLQPLTTTPTNPIPSIDPNLGIIKNKSTTEF